jgi:hypothetical protein
MALTTAVNDFVSSIYELFATFFKTFYNLIMSVVNAVTGFVTGILGVAGETAKFLIGKSVNSIAEYDSEKRIGNAFLIIIVGVGFVGYLRYMKSQGKPVVVANKKLN